MPEQSSFEAFRAKMEREIVKGSSTLRELFEVAVAIVSDTETLPGGDVAYPIHEALNWHVTRFGYRARETFHAAIFLNEDGSKWQAKLSNPGTDEKGKLRKYESPKANGSRAYLPPIPVVVRQKISQRYNITFSSGGSFWDFVAAHPEIPIVVTEGAKKGLCLLSHEYVAVPLCGVNNGVNKYESVKIAGERVRKLKPELIPDLARFAQPGRQWILAFDQDAAFATRLNVESALDDLAFHLEQAGGVVQIATWDGQNGQCKGVDNLITTKGGEAWEQALAQAVPSQEWRISRRLKQAVRRKPDLHIGDREFKDAVEKCPKKGMVAFWGGKGVGKTQAMSLMIGDLPYLSTTALRSVARDQAATFPNCVFVGDGDRYGDRLLSVDGSPAQGGSVCIPSLLKVASVPATILLVDEMLSLLDFSLKSKLANKDGMRRLLIEEFERRIREADLVVIGDADLTEDVLQWLEAVRGERVFLVRSDRKPLQYQASVIDGDRGEALAMLQQRGEAMPEGRILYLNCDSKKQAHAIAELVGIEQSLVITSDTSGGDAESKFLASKGTDIPGLAAQGIRFIISSPSVCQGFSIVQNTHLIDSVWGFYQGCSIAPNGMAQALDRVRSAEVPRFIHVEKKGSASSQLSKAQSVATFLREFKAASTVSARLVRDALTPQAEQQLNSIGWDSDRHLKMLASLEVSRNRGMAEMRHTLIALLKHEGKTVQVVAPTVTKAEAKAAKTALKSISKQLEEARWHAVAVAATITPEQALALSGATMALNPEQLLSLEKFYLAEFYRLETVAVADVAFDKDGRTRQQLRRLERVLNPELATETTAASINKSSTCPQDWSKAALQVSLLEKVGAAAFIRSICGGDVEAYQADDDAIKAIVAECQKHPTEFRIAFGFRNIDKITELQVIGTLLDWVGIERERKRTRINGQIASHYQINKTRLSELLAIVDRRKRVDPPPLLKELNKGGGSGDETEAIDPSWFTPENLAEIRRQYSQVGKAILEWTPLQVFERAIA